MRIEKRLSPQVLTITIRYIQLNNKFNLISINNFFFNNKNKEIKANLVIFLLAGFETTSSSLAYSIYMLAKHSDEMKKIQDEIDLNLSSKKNVNLKKNLKKN